MAAFFISSMPNNLNAQEKDGSAKEKKFQLVNFSGFYSEGSEKINRGSLENFKSLAPNSEILDDDLTGFDVYSYTGRSLVETYSVNCGFQFTDKEKSKLKKNSEIRIGLNFSRHLHLSSSFDKYLFSDPQSYPDSNIHYNYSMNSSSKQLQLDLSYLYNILPDARFSFYVGLGFQPGLHYSNVTRVSNSIRSYSTSNTPNDEHYWDYGHSLSRGEVFKNKAGFSLSANVPIGVDLKLSKKDPFLRSVHLFLEARPSAKLLFLPTLSPIAYAHLNIGGGIRFCRN